MAARGSLARFGLIARGAQVNLRNVLRSDTPKAFRLLALRSSGWVALAVTRQGSHGPGRACINASGSSADSLAVPEGPPRLSERVPWTGCGASMCPTRFPRSGLPAGASLPSPGSSEASSPASTVLPKRYDFLPPVPPRFVAFAWRYLSVHSFFSLPGGRVHRRGPELVTRYLRPGFR